jgi:hypothetical protein
MLLSVDDAWVLIQLAVGRRLPGKTVTSVSAEYQRVAIRMAAASPLNRMMIWRSFLEGQRAENPVTLAIGQEGLDGPGRAPAWFQRWFQQGMPKPVPGIHPGFERRAELNEDVAAEDGDEHLRPPGFVEGKRRGRRVRRGPEPEPTSSRNGPPL